MDQSRPHPGLRTLSTAVPRALIRGYQLLTLGALRRCRFSPSCSEYFHQALLERGLWKGLVRGTHRILRCHPWHPGGYDPLSN